MSPVLSATLPGLPGTFGSATVNPTPFVLTIGSDGTISCGDDGASLAQPSTGLVGAGAAVTNIEAASNPVTAVDLVAALDRAARTTIAPTVAVKMGAAEPVRIAQPVTADVVDPTVPAPVFATPPVKAPASGYVSTPAPTSVPLQVINVSPGAALVAAATVKPSIVKTTDLPMPVFETSAAFVPLVPAQGVGVRTPEQPAIVPERAVRAAPPAVAIPVLVTPAPAPVLAGALDPVVPTSGTVPPAVEATPAELVDVPAPVMASGKPSVQPKAQPPVAPNPVVLSPVALPVETPKAETPPPVASESSPIQAVKAPPQVPAPVIDAELAESPPSECIKVAVAPATDGATVDHKVGESDEPEHHDVAQPAASVFPALPVNPLAAVIAVTPVVVPKADAEPEQPVTTVIQTAQLPDAKTTTRTGKPTKSPETPVGKPADPAMAALFSMAHEAAKATEPVRTEPSVDVSVTMLSDTASDADAVPTFILPTAAAAVRSPASAVAAQPLAAPEVMINRHLDLARGDAWLDTLAQDIAAAAGTGDKLRFGLQPERLGKLDVEVSRHDNGVSVHMTTRNEETRAIIAAAQPRLVDELRANGTRVLAADVTSQMNAQTDSQSGNAQRRPAASFIEAAIDTRAPAAAATTNKASAAGRYA